MKNVSKVTGVLTIVKRLRSSYNGNPRYLVSVDGVEASTAVDSSEGYTVTNYRDKMVTCDIGLHYGVATIENIEEIKK